MLTCAWKSKMKENPRSPSSPGSDLLPEIYTLPSLPREGAGVVFI